MRETWVRSLGREVPLEKEMATHSNILAWRMQRTEEPGRLQFTGSQRVRHDWATSLCYFLNSFLALLAPLCLQVSSQGLCHHSSSANRFVNTIFLCSIYICWASLVAQRLKHLPAMRETWVRSLGREVPLEKEMATHSSILAWRIPRTEEPGEPQFTGSQRVGHDWATSLSLSFFVILWS